MHQQPKPAKKESNWRDEIICVVIFKWFQPNCLNFLQVLSWFIIDAARFLTWVLANKHCPCAIFQWISINSHICVHTHVHQIKQNPCHLQVDLNKLPNVHTHTTHMCIRLSIVLAIFRWIFTIPILTCGSDSSGQPCKWQIVLFPNWVWFSSTATITSINMCIKETWMWARWFWQRFTDFDARQTDRHTTNHLKSF